jgi:hypothetical protein
MRKLRIFLAALLLVPMLTSNAMAFNTESDDAFNPTRPRAGICYFYWNGMWYAYDC